MPAQTNCTCDSYTNILHMKSILFRFFFDFCFVSLLHGYKFPNVLCDLISNLSIGCDDYLNKFVQFIIFAWLRSIYSLLSFISMIQIEIFDRGKWTRAIFFWLTWSHLLCTVKMLTNNFVYAFFKNERMEFGFHFFFFCLKFWLRFSLKFKKQTKIITIKWRMT